MAGTIVQENGAVYKAIGNSLKAVNYKMTDPDEEKSWHGRSKDEVMMDALFEQFTPMVASDKYLEALQHFNSDLSRQYFKYNRATLIHPDLPYVLKTIRKDGTKIGLNTGYSKKMQKQMIEHLNLGKYIDCFVSTDHVTRGRPYPYMIHRLMEDLEIPNVQSVAKMGDTVIDMQEGKNAGCGLLVGVLSGAAKRKDFESCGIVDKIYGSIMDLYN